MPEESSAEKTEEPTAHRLAKAREEGQVPQSKELPSAMMIGALILMLALMAPRLLQWSIDQAIVGLGRLYPGPITPEGFVSLMVSRGMTALWMLMPFMLIGVAVSVAASLIGSGWAFSVKKLTPDLKNINPVKGLKNVFSKDSLVNLVTSVAKISLVGYVAWTYLHSRVRDMMALAGSSTERSLVVISQMVLGLMLRIVVVLSIIAVADLIWQRRSYRKKLKMTKQEVKEELKSQEGSPEVRGRIRGKQMEMARKRMLQDVAEADVVVTNPTHYAVALRYDAERMDAPTVVAKGADLLCQRIKDVAYKHDVPVVERPQLARALYATAEIGQAIPETLFVAVAEVLAMIYRMRKRRAGAGANGSADPDRDHQPNGHATR